MKMIIGIAGKKQSGKDLACSIIQEFLQPERSMRVAFADSLKEEVAKACGVSVQYIEKYKDNFRLILQGWGTDFRRKIFGEQYWTAEYLRKLLALNHIDYIITPDIRFKNEYEVIKQLGGVVIKIHRDLPNVDSHISENELNHYKFDYDIINNGTLFEIRNQLEDLVKEIKKP